MDLKTFTEALQSRSNTAHLVLVLAPRHEIIQAFVDCPEALASARVLGFDHPSIRVLELIAEADAELARRAVDAALKGAEI